jgi:4'-phosphopantetheinyl transferase
VRASIDRCPAVRVAETCTGAAGIVDVWYWMYEPVDEETLARAWGDLLAAEERERYQRLRFARDRRLYLATRALVRTVLSQYAAVSPRNWRFETDPSGKPRIAAPEVRPALHFNLANTPGVVTCAVSVAHEHVGIDVERTDRTVDFIGLADRTFAPSESRQLRAMAAADVQRRFFTYWTLKESYVKARGRGLSLPLDRFCFTIDEAAVQVAFDTNTPDEHESAWSFASINIPPSHLIGVAVRTNGAILSLRAAHVVADNPALSIHE